MYVVVVAGVIAATTRVLWGMDGKKQQVVVAVPLLVEKNEIDTFREELAKTFQSNNKHSKFLWPSFDENAKTAADGSAPK